MCGRYTLSAEELLLKQQYGIDIPKDYKPRYNIAPSQEILTITQEEVGKFTTMRWGLLPFWYKEEKKDSYKRKPFLINARSETLQEKVSFKKPFASRRCIVPADGFYEWVKQGDKRIPYYIHLEERRLFSIPGLYEERVDKHGEVTYTCTLITTSPNKEMKPIHDRMPVIFGTEEEKLWLDESTPTEVLQDMLQPYPNGQLQVDHVSDRVNSAMHTGRDLITPIA